MKTQTLRWTDAGGWETDGQPVDATLVIYFASKKILQNGTVVQELMSRFPTASFAGCSTGGEIFGSDVQDDSLVAAAIHFERTRVAVVTRPYRADQALQPAAHEIGKSLTAPDLRALFVLCDGTLINGSSLIDGLRDIVGENVTITGGLAGDGDVFQETLVGNPPRQGNILTVGFYGPAFRIGYGSVGGWEPFGPERRITRSDGNVLYELDGEPALALYKRYLGDEANSLPGSALHFPIQIRPNDNANGELVRTILNVDEAQQTMTFAGDMPEGAEAQLMRGTKARLVAAAGEAAQRAHLSVDRPLAIMISCIGRKLLMGQRVEHEVETAVEALGAQCKTIGFYSYGEISPHPTTNRCELHNQTMTLTTFAEV